MSRRERKSRAALPYRKYPIRRVLMECNRRLAGARGPRAFEAMAALIYRSPQVASGVVYLGDCCADGKHKSDHCCMARLMSRCGRTAHRAKYDLADAGLVKLHNAGRGLCPCSRCGGDPGKKAGGSILNTRGEIVGAATGYELNPETFAAPVERRKPTGAAAPPSEHRSPVERATIESGRRKLADALEKLRGRAGP